MDKLEKFEFIAPRALFLAITIFMGYFIFTRSITNEIVLEGGNIQKAIETNQYR